MTKRFSATFIVIIMSISFGGCDTATREALGIKRKAPDEFKVVANKPLSLPPEFNLRPIASKGESINNPELGYAKIRKIMFEKAAAHLIAPKSDITAAETNFLGRMSDVKSNPNIKRILQDEYEAEKSIREGRNVIDNLTALSLNKDTSNTEVTVDAEKERYRIIRNRRNGDPITEGEVPTVQRKEGLLNSIFGF